MPKLPVNRHRTSLLQSHLHPSSPSSFPLLPHPLTPSFLFDGRSPVIQDIVEFPPFYLFPCQTREYWGFCNFNRRQLIVARDTK
ncbi:hypothetical protein CEXT_465211 [Caerostris extrusa]|uniref:Uncharacterized protein n=1 Tax=Caerostris extrusa TaxID=172846 RepID=A0AAV4WUD6_CAEEX|nr:hypothetical protein CEXT_465211 [Caerostris extrusa]